jgi:excisionase family DNA binding protein
LDDLWHIFAAGRNKPTGLAQYRARPTFRGRAHDGSSSHSWRGPRLFTVGEACDLLKVRRTKLYEMVRAGKLAMTKLDGCTRVSSTEIERIIAAHTLAAA